MPTWKNTWSSTASCNPAKTQNPAQCLLCGIFLCIALVRYRCSRRIYRVLPTCSDRTKPSRSYSRTVSVLPSAPIRYLCSRRICRVLPTCSDRTKPSQSNSPPLQPQNPSGAAYLLGWHESQLLKRAAHLLDCLLLSATVAAAESVGCCPSARLSAPARYRCRCRICRVPPTCSDRTKPSRSYSRTAPVFLTKTYKNSPAGAVSAITFCSTAVPMPFP